MDLDERAEERAGASAMTTPSERLAAGHPAASMERKLARRKIEVAAAATARMDQLLEPALDELRIAIRDGNGAGVYFDVPRVRAAMAQAKRAIELAQHVATSVGWPTNEDYDQ